MRDLSSDQGLNPHPLQWKCGVLTTGPPGKSLLSFLKYILYFQTLYFYMLFYLYIYLKYLYFIFILMYVIHFLKECKTNSNRLNILLKTI